MYGPKLISKPPHLLKHLCLLTQLHSYTSAKHMEPEVTHCLFFKTKRLGKDGKTMFFFSRAV